MSRPCYFCGMRIYGERNEKTGNLVLRDAIDPDHPPHNCSVQDMIWQHEHKNEWEVRKLLASIGKTKTN
jgi:hypothetical protein